LVGIPGETAIQESLREHHTICNAKFNNWHESTNNHGSDQGNAHIAIPVTIEIGILADQYFTESGDIKFTQVGVK